MLRRESRAAHRPSAVVLIALCVLWLLAGAVLGPIVDEALTSRPTTVRVPIARAVADERAPLVAALRAGKAQRTRVVRRASSDDVDVLFRGFL
jgi:hypothetical protein